METGSYKCPMCERTMARDLVLFLGHTQQHIIDRIKQEHPEWVEKDGVCKPCAEYYERQISGGWQDANIGPKERKKRKVLAWVMTAVSVVSLFFIIAARPPRLLRPLIFLPVFFAVLCFLEERKKTCVILSELEAQNMDSGQNKICDLKIAKGLKAQGRKIMVQSVLGALFLTAVLLFLP